MDTFGFLQYHIDYQSSLAIPRHCNNCIDVSVTWYGWSSIERDITMMMLTMTAEWSRFRAAKKRIQIGMRATLSVCLAGWVATLVIVAGSISQRAGAIWPSRPWFWLSGTDVYNLTWCPMIYDLKFPHKY